MSEEEKKAIEKLNSKNETTWNDTIRQIKREEITDVVITRQKYITTILNLIDKQQKEIEELKEKNADHLEALTEWVNGERINDIKHISKDKIRKLKEYYEDSFKYAENEIESNNIYVSIKILEKLLEEE